MFSFPCSEAIGIGQCIADIYTWSLSIVGIIAFATAIYAGVIWMTAAGNASKIKEAKDRMSNAVLGIVLLFSSFLILNTINPDLTSGTFVFTEIEGSTEERDYVGFTGSNPFVPVSPTPIPGRPVPPAPSGAPLVRVGVESIEDRGVSGGRNVYRVNFFDGEWVDFEANRPLDDIPLGLSAFSFGTGGLGDPPVSSSPAFQGGNGVFHLSLFRSGPGWIHTTIHVGYGGEVAGIPIMPGPMRIGWRNTQNGTAHEVIFDLTITEEITPGWEPNYVTYEYFGLNPPDFIKELPKFYNTSIRNIGLIIHRDQAEKAVTDGVATRVPCFTGRENLICFYETILLKEEFIKLYGGESAENI